MPTSNGNAWPAIADAIDSIAAQYMDEFNLPGLAIAASRDDRLVVARAYGHADIDTDRALEPDDQILMGSNTKALVSGPTTARALADEGLDAESVLLYGPDGLFEGRFDEDIAIGSAATGNPAAWYFKITIQHLLDHGAGFDGADREGTKELFGVTDDELTYELVHKHFLRTRKLQFEPGTDNDYDNHHFGVLKLVIEALSGMDAVDYARTRYLRPLRLAREIEIRAKAPRPSTAAPHRYVGGDRSRLESYTPNYENDLGFFAGGFRGSSQDLVELMTKLADRYTPSQLDRLGFGRRNVTATMQWGDDTTAYLGHRGRVGGGTSYIRMTVDGINLAIQTNISNRDAADDIFGIANQIVDLVRGADIPQHYNIWKRCTLPALPGGFSQVAFHGIPARSYQCRFDQLVGGGYRPKWIDVSTVNGAPFFNVVFGPGAGPSWRAFHGLSGSQYQSRFDQLVEAGYRPVQVDSYLNRRGRVRYAGFFDKSGGGAFSAYHGLSPAQHQERFDDLTAGGYRPTSLSVVVVNGNRRYTGVYEKGIAGSFWVRSTLTPAQYQTAFNRQRLAGRRPVYLNGYNDAQGKPRLVAIFSSKPDRTFRARHGMTSGQYQDRWDEATKDGFGTDVVTAYEVGSGPRYAAIWTK